jgi:hypothetical protein
MNEPVAFIKDRELGYMLAVKQDGATEWNTSLGLYPSSGDVPLFTAQPKRKWVGLTNDEKNEAIDTLMPNLGGEYYRGDVEQIACALEAKIKAKNT